MRRLEEIEKTYPVLQGQDSPTLNVGGRASATFEKVPHLERMMSLDNVFSEEQFLAWAEKTERDAGQVLNYLCELKIDGLAINLRYENGVLTGATTRGDGVVGEDVTANVLTIQGIPHRLLGSGYPEIMEVRGEIYIPTAEFAELNKRLAEAKRKPFQTLVIQQVVLFDKLTRRKLLHVHCDYLCMELVLGMMFQLITSLKFMDC